MRIEHAEAKRITKQVSLSADLAITGGGLAGLCCAITAARKGIKVVLVQDRPVLGGNSSSEVRLWVLGATSHMGNNNRWAREGGVINEILIENAFRNQESNPLIFDTILLEKIVEEKNITLLLNTAVHELEKSVTGRIERLKAFCSQNSTTYLIEAPLFCDASGDGITAFLAGASFRMGAESQHEFGEKFAPSEEYGELLGHSLYFYTKDTGLPVKFIPPSFALSDITEIPRYKQFSATDSGCSLWWIEYGGRLDTVHDTELIKWELWKVVYGVWNHIKNSGDFPDAENLTLEWVGTIPGKRESRRFEGDYMLKQQDVIEQKIFDDVVAYGGWSIDLHPADGVFSEKPGCNQWHSKGIYGIPYRCYYSKDVPNLYIAGRLMSTTHVAFGSSRVMGTCAHGGQAIGMAAVLCKKHGALPIEIGKKHIKELQQELLKCGQSLPGIALRDEKDLMQIATEIIGESLKLGELPNDGIWLRLIHSSAQMLPVAPGKMMQLTVQLKTTKPTSLTVQLRNSSKNFNHTPDVILEEQHFDLLTGEQVLVLDFNTTFSEHCYAFVSFLKNEEVEIASTTRLVTGIVSVFNSTSPAVSNYGKQSSSTDIGVEEFEFWCPGRKPMGQNIAMKIEPAIDLFNAYNLINGIHRPVASPNAWVAPLDSDVAQLLVRWSTKQSISRIDFSFDCDYDHPMENVLMRQPYAVQPYCASDIEIYSGDQFVGEIRNNHQAMATVCLGEPVVTDELKFVVKNENKQSPVSLFEIRCYEEQ
ncbi:FAD-dependent oxidoreductase [Pedobacter frigiditerrae]|uniref:FAD-dependent oxidoreductase n=1 Tax=Pedobacter frigiditerrae TaxID=2530452 RepID=A0A4R0MP20_9SPHI|nr:FAD-dependent oxidoreductase [Pedobacter frigiditerrae]TCC88571.1 FAD-dependent oxidoreductase [Pedobacter frigiditerrae]